MPSELILFLTTCLKTSYIKQEVNEHIMKIKSNLICINVLSNNIIHILKVYEFYVVKNIKI